MIRYYLTSFFCLLVQALSLSAQDFRLLPEGYFNSHGVDVMAFSDFYPEGHQGGVCVIMNGRRVATNGDIRLEATPGQWQPVVEYFPPDAETGIIEGQTGETVGWGTQEGVRGI